MSHLSFLNVKSDSCGKTELRNSHQSKNKKPALDWEGSVREDRALLCRLAAALLLIKSGRVHRTVGFPAYISELPRKTQTDRQTDLQPPFLSSLVLAVCESEQQFVLLFLAYVT